VIAVGKQGKSFLQVKEINDEPTHRTKGKFVRYLPTLAITCPSDGTIPFSSAFREWVQE
jgi:hypothetical protein